MTDSPIFRAPGNARTAFSGAIIDVAGYRSMFLFCAVFFLLAFVVMGFVTSGEKDDKPVPLG